MSISVPINIAENHWKTLEGLDAKIEKSVAEACRVCAQDKTRDIEVSVLLTNDEAVQELNKKYRDKDTPTNVLSFPGICNNEEIGPILLGDIILSYETILKESERDNKSLMDHVTHLVVHGVLHLCGYDHEEEETAREMEMIEISILKEFGIKNPYGL